MTKKQRKIKGKFDTKKLVDGLNQIPGVRVSIASIEYEITIDDDQAEQLPKNKEEDS